MQCSFALCFIFKWKWYTNEAQGLKRKRWVSSSITASQQHSCFHQSALCYRLIDEIAKLYELTFDLLTNPGISLIFGNLLLEDFSSFSTTNLRRMFKRKRFKSNDEVIGRNLLSISAVLEERSIKKVSKF